jgi:hypothetical protein
MLMSEKSTTNDQVLKGAVADGELKPYTRPEILSTEVLESVANVCSGGGGGLQAKADPNAPHFCDSGLLRS